MDTVRKWFTLNGKRYSVRGKNEREAYLKMAAKKAELENNNTVISNKMTVEKFARECVATYKIRQKPHTQKVYLDRMNCCIFRYIGNMPLRDVTRLDLIKILNRQSGNSAFQIRTVRQQLQFIFGKAFENHLIAANPAVNLPAPSGGVKNRRQLSSTEENHFLAVCRTDHRYIVFLLMYYCGCRPVEARECVGSDIQFIEKCPVLHIRGSKSQNADRFVPIPAELYDMIKNCPPAEPIAKTLHGCKYTESAFRCAFNSLRRDMNLSMGCKLYRNQLVPPLPLADDFVPYCLRHTYCCNLKKANVDMRNAMYLMGHSDIRLTANIYTHTDANDILTAAAQISDYAAVKNGAANGAPPAPL